MKIIKFLFNGPIDKILNNRTLSMNQLPTAIRMFNQTGKLSIVNETRFNAAHVSTNAKRIIVHLRVYALNTPLYIELILLSLALYS